MVLSSLGFRTCGAQNSAPPLLDGLKIVNPFSMELLKRNHPGPMAHPSGRVLPKFLTSNPLQNRTLTRQTEVLTAASLKSGGARPHQSRISMGLTMARFCKVS